MTPPQIFFENLAFLETQSDGLLLNSYSDLRACSHNLKKGMCEWKTPRTAASVNDFSVLSGIWKGEKFLK